MDFLDDAAWDFESIKWYDKLLMFATEYPIKQIELCSANDLCVLSEKEPGLSVLNLYSLPPTLKKFKTEEEALSRNSDLKIKAGAFVTNNITQLACIYGQNSFYASEEGLEGINVYKNDLKSDKIVSSGIIKTKGLVNPRIVAKSDAIVAAGSAKEDILTLSNGGEVIVSHKWDDQNSSSLDNSLRSAFLTDSTIIACSTVNRKSCVYDVRQEKPSHLLPGESVSGQWSVGTNYYEAFPQSVTTIGFISSCGELRTYDTRRMDATTCRFSLGSVPRTGDDTDIDGSLPVINFDPSDDGGRLSVSGLDSSIRVIETRPCFSIVFTHSGHDHTDTCEAGSLALSHLWYHPAGGQSRTLISSSLNASINCWTYNP